MLAMLLPRGYTAQIQVAEYIAQLQEDIMGKMIILTTQIGPAVKQAVEFLIRKTKSFIPAPQAALKKVRVQSKTL